MFKKILKWFLPLIFVLLFFILLRQINFDLLIWYVKEFSFWEIIIVLALFFLAYFFKSLRLNYLNKKIKLFEMFYITMIHNFFLTVLPFKLWELVYVKKLKENWIKTSKWVSDIIVLRLYDILVIWFLVFWFSFFMYGLNIKIILSLIFIILIFFIIFFQTKIILQILSYLKQKSQNKIYQKVINFSIEGFWHILDFKNKDKIHILILSLLVWLWGFVPWVFVLNILENFWIFNSVIVVLFSLLISFLPINSPAWLWTIHAWWITGLIFVWVEYSSAVNISMFLYWFFIIQLIFNYSILSLFKFSFIK